MTERGPITMDYPASDVDSPTRNNPPVSTRGSSRSISSNEARRLQQRIAELENENNRYRQRSVLTPSTRHHNPVIHTNGLAGRNRSSAELSGDTRDKIKMNPPPLFQHGDDIRHWMLEVDDFFRIRQVVDPTVQATVACSYLGDVIRRRTQRLRLAEDTEPFETWHNLKVWLLKNYGPPDASLDAELAMDKLEMKAGDKIQTFINQFETIVADLTWNDPAVCAAFRRKITGEISSTIHLLRPHGWPKSFSEFKDVAQEAENHLRIKKRNLEDHQGDPQEKKVRFSEPRGGRKYNARRPSPFRERSANIGANANSPPNDIPVNLELRAEKRRRRDGGLCMNCGRDNHWAMKCKAPCNLPGEGGSKPRPIEPKNE
ncbi:hypothetical protein MMC06_004390 [Schaereria dolodes]|nr:hypothetical protein [Schaereria dolodes]